MKKSRKTLFLFSISYLFVVSIFAQPFSLDETFQSTYVFRYFNYFDEVGNIGSLYEMDDGSLRIGGAFQDPYDNTFIGNNIKLFSSGLFDPNYGFGTAGDGVAINYFYPYIYISGWSGMVRSDYQTAAIDTVFTYYSVSSNWSVHSPHIYRLDNGDLLVGGSLFYQLWTPEERRTSIARIFENGIYDTSFHHDADNAVMHFEKYDEARLMIFGLFHTYDNIPMRAVARIYNNGSLDTTFHSIVVGMNGLVSKIFVQEDGKIILGGNFFIAGTTERIGMVRLMPNGDLDTTFNNFNNAQSPNGLLPNYPNDENQYSIYAMVKTSNDKLLIGGDFTNYQGHERHNIVLADLNGYIDTTVFTGSGIDTSLGLPASWAQTRVACIIHAQNDKYYVAGQFSGFNGQMVEPIIRLNPHNYVGIEEQTEEQGLMIYPNPACNKINIKSFKNIEELEIYNLQGQLMQTVGNSIQQQSIDVSQFLPGTYFLRAIGKQEVWVKKFVVVR
ncbi:MAG: T9SS type A sorting domain-containing protein [Bacteroidales bacterium]|nr:T9SS type A sorting domain-containing protein [Bacteroidales bacterium]MCF8456339.1 T9SS type A sorting domain-containing protein [Bacteroidales bacterium]